ncbi:unnamed protein product [Candidula unifasciata]|uniref:NIPSNAP domain-containing protein n=1 Tax=Candidula unifasciata TaxID=100452 RepID=A0A8S3YHT5_9EUPU|nr:unnamed protein product [Candidula unifasciata]
MAGLGRVLGSRPLQQLFSAKFVSVSEASVSRFPHIHTATALLKDNKDKDQDDDDDSSKGWFSRFKKISKPEQAHSAVLAGQEAVYEFQYHSVRPEYMEEYLNQFGSFQKLMKEKGAGAELVGSFTVVIGEQDEAVHIWQYAGGIPSTDSG